MRPELLFPASGLILAVLGWAMATRRVRPNRWYGLRVPATFADADASATASRRVDMRRPMVRIPTDGGAAMATRKASSTKRTLIAPKGDKRYVRRDEVGRFEESDDVGRSLRADVKKAAKKKVPAGQGDRGDQKR